MIPQLTQPQAFALAFMGFALPESAPAFSELLIQVILSDAARNPKPIAFEPAELAEGLALNRKRCCPDGDESGIRSFIFEESPAGIAARNFLVRWARARQKKLLHHHKESSAAKELNYDEKPNPLSSSGQSPRQF